jgi:hypothetical protein
LSPEGEIHTDSPISSQDEPPPHLYVSDKTSTHLDCTLSDDDKVGVVVVEADHMEECSLFVRVCVSLCVVGARTNTCVYGRKWRVEATLCV